MLAADIRPRSLFQKLSLAQRACHRATSAIANLTILTAEKYLKLYFFRQNLNRVNTFSAKRSKFINEKYEGVIMEIHGVEKMDKYIRTDNFNMDKILKKKKILR